ncbi:opioid growth factor receptor-like protein [Cricetulus griseus]|nr:opioid growth factor receptor-like protein [Cricetulus griseus]
MNDQDCDSTWEDEREEDHEVGQSDDKGDKDGDAKETRPVVFQSRMTRYRNWQAMQDMRRYRYHYPDLAYQDCNGDISNPSFYKNEICFQPNVLFIEEILHNWKDNYDLLEENHSYIQWLFPLWEPGVNRHAKPLTLKEVEAFKSSEEVKEHLVRAYDEFMLGFYGIQLEDWDTGAVCRAQNFQPRFHNLNSHRHNSLRITHPQFTGRAGLRALPGTAGPLLSGGDTGTAPIAQRVSECPGLLHVRPALQTPVPGACVLCMGAL